MAEARRKFDADFKEGMVRLVRETGRPIAQVAWELGINEGTLGELGERGPAPPRGGRRVLSEVSGRSWPGCGKRTPS